MQLNLARKWRSKNFDEIKGQPLVVRLVKNSLYRNLLFPVYLLSGMRGCGKTSLARIFAAALNCQNLEKFQKDPSQLLPCLTCSSCLAMEATNHPDFIEIDAASHTGVDNVRQIIEAASFVPVLGTRKIYLIDEAHMLSKAAFNAFLKILEEPPTSVVFMLATTDPHKIIETVSSRCFQLFLEPIRLQEIVHHLSSICKEEGLSIDSEALTLIAQESEGSMRDALNFLERLRALMNTDMAQTETGATVISASLVRELLGSIDDQRVIELFKEILMGDPNTVLSAYERLEIARYTPFMVWKKLVEVLRRSLWIKHGVHPDDKVFSETFEQAVRVVSYEQLIALFELCSTYELLFSKTSVPGTLLEMLLLKMVSVIRNETVSQAPSPKILKKSETKVAQTPVSQATVSQTMHKGEIVYQATAPQPTGSQPRGSQPKTYQANASQALSQTKIQSDPGPKNASVNEMSSESLRYESTAVQGFTIEKQISDKVPSTANDLSNINAPTALEGVVVPSAPAHDETALPEVSLWASCLAELATIQDPLVVSIFKQGTYQAFNEQNYSLELLFSKDLLFFKEWLENTQSVWHPIIKKHFGDQVHMLPSFTGPSTKERPLKLDASAKARAEMQAMQDSSQKVPSKASAPVALPRLATQGVATQGVASQRVTPQRVVSQRVVSQQEAGEKELKQVDAETWQKGALVLSIFPGTLTVKDGS